jgi:amidohydrolase
MDRVRAKEQVCERVDALRPALVTLCSALHTTVETALEEHRAQAWLCDFLAGEGLDVEQGFGSYPTAFRASAGSANGPRVGVVLEYDGLAEYGQSCGHNVVAAAGAGAAAAVATVADALGGSVVALGTPGEEAGGVKSALAAAGFFEGVDALMLVFPGMANIADSRTLSAAGVRVEYFGKAAHAAAHPELGVNALDAMLAAFNGVNALRQQLPSDVRVHGIITKGGTLPQVTPDHTAAIFIVRANSPSGVEAAIARIDACLEGAGTMTGAHLERSWRSPSLPLLSNRVLAAAFAANLQALGTDCERRDELAGAWSGDIGAVSWDVPTIQPQVQLTGRDVSPHSHEFHDAAGTPAAYDCAVLAAKAMATTAVDLLADPTLLEAVRRWHAEPG